MWPFSQDPVNLLSPVSPLEHAIIKVTKCNTVFTNRSDVTGIIVTEMVTWGTSAVFGELELMQTIQFLRLLMLQRTYYIIELLY